MLVFIQRYFADVLFYQLGDDFFVVIKIRDVLWRDALAPRRSRAARLAIIFLRRVDSVTFGRDFCAIFITVLSGDDAFQFRHAVLTRAFTAALVVQTTVRVRGF